MLSALLVAITVTSAALTAEPVDLTGPWRVYYGDRAECASPSFDDSAWRQVNVPGDWSPPGTDYDGAGWLRTRFVVPPSVESQDMALDLGKIDDSDRTYLNGELIGVTSGWNRQRAYAIPKRLIRWGAENVIAIQVQDDGGGGGIYEGPVHLRPLTPEERNTLGFYGSADRRPVIPDDERRAMPKTRPFRLTWAVKGGIRVPLIDGRGLWGTSGHHSNMPLVQACYEAPILAQQGWNNLRLGIRPVGYTLDDWVEVTRAFDRQGVACIWSAYSMANDFISRVCGMGENDLGNSDSIIRESGERRQCFVGAGALGNPWNPAYLANSDRMWQRVTEAMAPFKCVIGYQVTNEINMENGSYDAYARADWQRFLRGLFGDNTPAADTNRDGAWFNRACGKTYASWDEVEQFRGEDWKDPAKMLLKDIWLGDTYARYIQREARVIRAQAPQALVGASICVPVSAPVDLSLVCSMPDVSAAYINTYGCWLGSGLLMPAIAHTYGRPAIASEVNYPAGGYREARWTMLTLLPYYDGFQWFGYNPKDGSEQLQDEMVSEYGGKYGLIDHGMTATYDGDGDPRRAGDVCKAVKYDPRFALIPQLAPFVGKLSSRTDDRILWITASGYRPDYQEDHQESQMFRARVTSDAALMLKPDALSLAARKVVIYRNIESPCISRAIYRKLKAYVRGGGTVVTGAWHIASRDTLLGEDNARDWWQGLRPVRTERSSDGATSISYGNSHLEAAGVYQYLVSASPKVEADGTVTDSTGASYPLVLVRREGRGKWVLVNYPAIFRMTEPDGRWQGEKHSARFRLLRAIVRKHAGVDLPYRYEMQVYNGERCGLAIKEPVPSGAPAVPDAEPSFRANMPTVAFEVFEKKLYGGACIRSRLGRIEIPERLQAGDARLWVLKPYGRPIVLYADGTEKNRGRADDGVYRDGMLSFEFAEQAFISSPERPKSVTTGGKSIAFDYNPETRLLTVKRQGAPARAVVRY